MNRPLPRKTELCRPKHEKLAAVTTLFLFLLISFLAPVLLVAKNKKDNSKPIASSLVLKGVPVQDLSPEQAILQALNRLSFGPRPGDLERVKQMGLQKWIDQQLRPETIDDSAVNARLERFPTLQMSSTQLLDEFPEAKVAAKREGVSVEEFKKEQQAQLQQAKSQPAAQAMQSDSDKADMLGLPKFEVGNMDSDANPGQAPGQAKAPRHRRQPPRSAAGQPSQLPAEGRRPHHARHHATTRAHRHHPPDQRVAGHGRIGPSAAVAVEDGRVAVEPPDAVRDQPTAHARHHHLAHRRGPRAEGRHFQPVSVAQRWRHAPARQAN